MKTIKHIVILLLSVFVLSCQTKDNCQDVICPAGAICDNGICISSNKNIVIQTNIVENTTWTRDNVYELSGRISVVSGVTLTIEAGTIIKGQSGIGTSASALIIARGGKINAIGSENLPIIFTSVADSIMPSDVAAGIYTSPNLDVKTQGLWGGLIILGNAPISASNSEVQIEGIPTTDINGLYGGNISNDNSGHLEYVSIRHGGTNIGNGNEINGLTLGGVGSGTIIRNIEIISNQDDGVEFFGGSVTVSNLLIMNPGDDGIDVDQSWSGNLDNFVVICGDATDHALEIDGPEGAMTGSYHLSNGSIQGNVNSELADYRACPTGINENLFFFDFPNPNLGRGDLSLSNPSGSTCVTDNFVNDVLIFINLEVILPAGVNLYDVFLNGVDATARAVSAKTVGANATVFNWSCVYQLNMLNDKF